MTINAGVLLADWEGALVEETSPHDPRRLFGAGIPISPGMSDFFYGAFRGGLYPREAISHYPRLLRYYMRHVLAKESVEQGGLWMLLRKHKPNALGSERAKAEHIVTTAASLGSRVVLLTRNLDEVGPEVFLAAKRHTIDRTAPAIDITLAVPDFSDRNATVTDLLEHDRTPRNMQDHGDDAYTFTLGSHALVHLVRVEPYSQEAGVHLAEQVSALPLAEPVKKL